MSGEPLPDAPREAPFARLLHRWFVQYNPLYLASATLVLIGLTLLSRALTREFSVAGQLLPGLASELYAFSLIGGAALLVRLGLPRPATLVALLAVLYQGDLALGTETHALLGGAGRLASALWLVAFLVKLRALAGALRLRPSRSAYAVPAVGALGLATVPHLSRLLAPQTLGAVVGLWLFAVLGAALWTKRAVDFRRASDAADPWYETVRRRALRATWLAWALLAFAHAACWARQYNLSPTLLAPALLLLATRWARSERAVVACVTLTLGFVGLAAPADLAATALMGAVVLVLGALLRPTAEEPAAAAGRGDYRGGVVEVAVEAPPFERAPAEERRRMLAWAGYSLYLAIWQTAGAPDHALALELALGAAMATAAWRARSVAIPVPLLATWTHWAIGARLLRAPQSTVQWAITTLSLGFALLGVAIATSWRLREREAPRDPGSRFTILGLE